MTNKLNVNINSDDHRDLLALKAETFRVLAYSGVGAINTFVGYGVILIAHGFFGVGLYFSNIIGYGIGLVISFILNRVLTFRHVRNLSFSVWIQVVRFMIVFMLAYGIQISTLWFLDTFSDLPFYVKQLIPLVVFVTVSYGGHRLWTFSEKESSR